MSNAVVISKTNRGTYVVAGVAEVMTEADALSLLETGTFPALHAPAAFSEPVVCVHEEPAAYRVLMSWR